MKFEWDQNKSQSNLKKHGIDFEEARSVFHDMFALIIDDPYHCNSEQREIIVGQSSEGRFLYVVFEETESSIRIISPRKLTSAERRRYEQNRPD